MSVLSEMICKQFAKGDKKRDSGLKTPYTITRCDTIAYGKDPMQVLDVYYPKGTLGKLPVIISVHGGGWVYGSKEVYQYYCMSLASLGFTVINFSYRLAPEHKFPTSLFDTNLVIEWMYTHEKDYPFDLDHVYMVGDSAGAHMLGMYSNICTNEDYASLFDFKIPHHFVPKAIGLNCGVYHMGKEGSELTDNLMKEFLEDMKDLDKVHVIPYMNEKFPPTYLMSSTGDFLLGQYPLMKERLEELHIKHQAKIYGDELNKLGHVFHCNMKSEDAFICNQEECAFFRSIG